MSKKNKLSTRRKRHEADLQREKATAIAKKAKEDREKQKKLESQGLKQKGKAKKKKGIRIRKGVQIRGIKVVDSESKKEVQRILKEEKEGKMDLSD